jgi:phosphoglycolate phosphatase
MKPRTIIFDLDGTIADPAKGITGSINFALKNLGRQEHPEKDLHKYIGPHLDTTFGELLKTADKTMLARATELFRERYVRIGYTENRIYDGIREVLGRLLKEGSTLCIVTMKRKDIAEKVLEFLEIKTAFAQVHGCGLNQSKPDLLRGILLDDNLGGQPAVMIGDRGTDFVAAASVSISSIAVGWGYGTEDELSMATYIVEMPSQLPTAIVKATRQY